MGKLGDRIGLLGWNVRRQPSEWEVEVDRLTETRSQALGG